MGKSKFVLVEPIPRKRAPWQLRMAEGFVYTLGVFVLAGHIWLLLTS